MKPILSCIAMFALALSADDDGEQLKRFIETFRQVGGEFVRDRFVAFEKQIPSENRIEWLRKIWESESASENNNAKINVTNYLLLTKLKTPWEETPIEPYIFSCIASDDHILRLNALNLIMTAKVGQDRRRTIALVCLGDKTDRIRSRAVTAASKLEDAKEILSAYVRMHENDPAFKQSIYAAKYFLDPNPKRTSEKEGR